MGNQQCKQSNCEICKSFKAKQDDMGIGGENCFNYNPPNCDFCEKECKNPIGLRGCFNYEPCLSEKQIEMMEMSHEWHNQNAIESHKSVLRVFMAMGKINHEEFKKSLNEFTENINSKHRVCPFFVELQKIKKDYLELSVEYAYETGNGIEEAEKELKEFTDSLVK
jgi:hypothetical protein